MGNLTKAEKFYGRLLYIYPTPYRKRFGSEMRQVFGIMYREHALADSPTLLLWGRTFTDLGVGAVVQYGEVIRSEMTMKAYFTNSANQKTFFWGVILMVPAGLFLLAAVMSNILKYPHLSNIQYQGITLKLFMACLILLPLLAVLINAVSLVRQIATKKSNALNLNFVKENFWTLAIMLVGLGWVAFLFGHDTASCAITYLPLLKWHAFQHCAATH